MDPMQPMEVDHPNEEYIMNASKSGLVDQNYTNCGTSVDMYQFSFDTTKKWNQGHIFHANSQQDISFEGVIDATNASNKREAMFLVHEISEQNRVEDMMCRSLNLKHTGILNPYVAAYNPQISKVVSAYNVPTQRFEDWLKAQKKSPSIPPEVQELLRTIYEAFEVMWQRGHTCDLLADPGSYYMVEGVIKIDPLRIRYKNRQEFNKMPFRRAFAKMISEYIHPVWRDGELLDFIELLENHRAGTISDILGAPVLLSPTRRELMYHKLDTSRLPFSQQKWLTKYAEPEVVGWKLKASNTDPVLKMMIQRQKKSDKLGIGFSSDFYGAFHFASIVTTHYEENFKKMGQGQWGVEKKGWVDSLLKQVLPRLLTRRYNSEYAPLSLGATTPSMPR